MVATRSILFLVMALFGLSSCLITDQIMTLQVEVMKPGIFTFPENINKVAIFNRDLYHSDTISFQYYHLGSLKTDTTIRNSEFSNRCVDALSEFLNDEGYFRQVVNYHDSLKRNVSESDKLDKAALIKNTKADFYIFLDYFNLKNTVFNGDYYIYTNAYLSWTFAFKEDTTIYVYGQIDTLTYTSDQITNAGLSKEGLKTGLRNSADYLGKSFGAKVIPNWMPVERMYYESKNPNMLKAENHAKQFDWLGAAQIWKNETNNKNAQIAAKACYNMALACEMEGKYDLAIDWLVKSYSLLPKNIEEHKLNCQRYINLLALRKKEIQRLDKQLRNLIQNHTTETPN